MRLHECVLATLALEAEPVDPRLGENGELVYKDQKLSQNELR